MSMFGAANFLSSSVFQIQRRLTPRPSNVSKALTYLKFLSTSTTPNPENKEARAAEESQEYVTSSSQSSSEADRGRSEFWRRKMRTFHGILDINKDGVVSFDDFQILVDRFIYLGHLQAQHQKEFREVVRNMWEERWGNVNPYNLVTTEQYLEDMNHIVNDKQLRKKVHHFLPYLFKAVDKDRNGFITVEEFKLFFNCLGLPGDAAVVSFTAIDENLDGRVTLKEFVKTGRDFFLTENQQSPSKMFWGPLVK